MVYLVQSLRDNPRLAEPPIAAARRSQTKETSSKDQGNAFKVQNVIPNRNGTGRALEISVRYKCCALGIQIQINAQ